MLLASCKAVKKGCAWDSSKASSRLESSESCAQLGVTWGLSAQVMLEEDTVPVRVLSVALPTILIPPEDTCLMSFALLALFFFFFFEHRS